MYFFIVMAHAVSSFHEVNKLHCIKLRIVFLLLMVIVNDSYIFVSIILFYKTVSCHSSMSSSSSFSYWFHHRHHFRFNKLRAAITQFPSLLTFFLFHQHSFILWLILIYCSVENVLLVLFGFLLDNLLMRNYHYPH